VSDVGFYLVAMLIAENNSSCRYNVVVEYAMQEKQMKNDEERSVITRQRLMTGLSDFLPGFGTPWMSSEGRGLQRGLNRNGSRR
jgi:hypothetical protein